MEGEALGEILLLRPSAMASLQYFPIPDSLSEHPVLYHSPTAESGFFGVSCNEFRNNATVGVSECLL